MKAESALIMDIYIYLFIYCQSNRVKLNFSPARRQVGIE